MSAWYPSPWSFHLHMLPLLNKAKENQKCLQIISHLLIVNLFQKLKNSTAKQQKNFVYKQGFLFHYIVRQTILPVKQYVIGSFIFKARKLFGKKITLSCTFNSPNGSFLFFFFCFNFQSRPRCKDHFANISIQKGCSLGTKRGYAIFFIASYANFGLSHKRRSWTVVPNVW